MVAAMNRRGPDDAGIYIDEHVALGHARLSIIDLSARGHQPMSNSDGSLIIVYNGETYNFRHERELLEKKGHAFSSRSDTEVVLRLYEEFGDDFLLRLRGMFALAIYDRRCGPGRGRLLLARDHLGVKPLLYTEVAGGLIFASEIKALLASGLVKRQIDPEALRLLLTFGSVVQPRTMLAEVCMLPPAHRLIFESGVARIERYWHLSDNRHPEIKRLPYAEQVKRIHEALTASVRSQMVSDVPVGAFLSGGVDSALLVALMAGEATRKVQTYSVGFGQEGVSIDETDDAQRIADFIGTEHERIIISGKEVAGDISTIAAALDQPSVDGVNSYFVSKAARRGVKVALSGTGGDECFGGYPWFVTMVQAARRFESPSWRQSVGHLLQLPFFDALARTRFAGHLDGWRGQTSFLSCYVRNYNIFGSVGAAQTLSAALRNKTACGKEMSRDLLAADELAGAQPLERVSALCMRGYLQNQLLRDIDAVSMFCSLEVRVPYLDVELIDLALCLPHSSKLADVSWVKRPEMSSYRATGTKKILLDIGQDLLPPGMAEQPKRGFAMPFDFWMRNELREVLEDSLAISKIKQRGFFDPGAVAALKQAFHEGRIGWSQPWLLMMTELWCRQVLDQS